MKTISVKHRIDIVGDSPQEMAALFALLGEETQFETTIQDVRNDRIALERAASDVIVYCVQSDERYAHTMDFVSQNASQVPIIVLLDHPTIDQTVDLMRAGSRGVVDWRNARRTLDLIRIVLDEKPISPSEAIYRSIVDQQTELICRYDAELRLLFVNRAYCEWQGIPAEELIGVKITEKIPAEDRERATAHIRVLTADNPVAVSIHAAILPDGSVRLIEWTDRAIFDASGQVSEYQGVGRDVTEREQQAQQLATYRAHFDAILDTMQDAFMSISLPDRQVIFVSRAFKEVFGYSHEKFVEDTDFFRQVIHPDDMEQTAQAMQTCLTEGFVELDHRIIWPDGQVRWIHRRAWLNYNESGQPTHVNDSARDITARKEVEEALRSSDAHLKSLINSQTNYLIRTDLDGHYTYWNPKFEREFGWLHEPDGMLGSLSIRSIMPYHHRRTREVVEKCFAEPGTPCQVELDKPKRDGTVCTTLWEFICLTDASGTPTMFQCAGIDITAQKQAQAIVRYQANLLQQVSDAIITTDNDLKITSWNKVATEIYGWTEAEALGQQMDELLGTEWLNESQSSAQASVVHTRHWRGEVRQTDKAGVQHYIIVSTNLLYDEYDNQIGAITVNHDITVKKKRNILQEQISQTLEATAQRQPLPSILEKLIRAVEEFEPDIRASVLLLDSETNQLRCGAAPSLPVAYNAAIDGISIGSGVGSCGTAAYERRLVIVEDIATDPLWKDFKDLAAVHGLSACWSQPVIGHNEQVLGTFALYYNETRRPSSDELDLIQLAARIAALVIEHAQSEQSLQRSEHRYRQMFELQNLPKLIIDTQTAQILDANPAAAEYYGYSIETLKSMTIMQINITEPQIIMEKMRQIRAKELSSCLFKQRVADGSVREVEVHSTEIEVQGQTVLYSTYIDVTARNHAQAALQAANQQLEQRVQERTQALEQAKDRIEAIFNHSGDGIVLLDKELKIKQSNNVFDQLFAIPHATSLDKLLLELMLDGDGTRLAAQLPTVIDQYETRRMEIKGKRVDGTLFDAEVSIAPVNSSDKPVENIVCIIRDITERKAQERQLRYHASLQESVSDAVIATDMNLYIQSWNPAAERIYGWKASEVVGKLGADIVQTKFISNQAQEQVLHDLKKQGYWTGEVIQRHKDGHVLHVLSSTVTFNDENGQPLGIVVVNHDITERKQAEVALSASEERYRLIANNVSDVIIKYDLQENGAICTYVSPSVKASLGYDEHEIMGQSTTGFLHPDDLDMVLATALEAIKAKKSEFRVTHRISHKAGHFIWSESSNTLILDESEQPIGGIAVFRDITERKHAEEALRESEERYRTTIATMTEGIVMESADGVIGVCNAAAEKILGLSADQMMGRTSLDPRWQAIHEDGSPFPGETHPAMVTLRTGEPLRGVVMGVHKPDGNLTWISINTQAVMNTGEAKPGAVVTTFTEITEQLLAEEEIRQKRAEERQMQLYLQALHQSTIRLTRAETLDEFYYTAVEEGLTRFGFERVGLLLYDSSDGGATGTYGTDAQGKLVDEYHLRLNPSSLTGILKRTLDREERFAFDEDAALYANFEPIGSGQNAVAALWNGEALGWLTIDNAVQHQPISQAQLDILALYALTVGSLLARKRAEFALRASEQRYRLLAENIKDVIVKVSLDGYLTFVTPSSYGLTRHRPEELIGMPVMATVHPDDEPVTQEKIAEAISSGAAFLTIQQRLHHKDGHYVWVEVTNTIVRDASTGAPLEIIGILHDITERKAAEEALKQALAKEKELGELKTRFVSMASHEFRTPLATILALVETLSAYRHKLSNEQIDGRFDKIKEQINHLKDIMEDVLLLARMQARRVEFNPVKLDLDALTRSVLDEFENQANIRHRLEYSVGEVLHEVILDRKLMRQLISNLVSNALKYSSEDKVVCIHLEYTASAVILKIRDEGIGIPEADLPHLFEPFHRAANVGTISGTGLGLVITKEAVELHGGTIAVESQLGVGTTFIIHIPISAGGVKNHVKDSSD